MKITLGERKTRKGQKAIVAAENPNKQNLCRFVGWIAGNPFGWDINGDAVSFDTPSPYDIVDTWTDPVPWDWSTTPPWINWIAMDSDGVWILFDGEPELLESRWSSGPGIYSCTIPFKHAPKWTGDWKLSKTCRPKEVAK